MTEEEFKFKSSGRAPVSVTVDASELESHASHCSARLVPGSPLPYLTGPVACSRLKASKLARVPGSPAARLVPGDQLLPSARLVPSSSSSQAPESCESLRGRESARPVAERQVTSLGGVSCWVSGVDGTLPVYEAALDGVAFVSVTTDDRQTDN